MKEGGDKLAEAVGSSQRQGWPSSGGWQWWRKGKGSGWRGAGTGCQRGRSGSRGLACGALQLAAGKLVATGNRRRWWTEEEEEILGLVS